MAKPRIIIADTDINYIIPLQAKFAEEFPDETELEIITDQSYFEQLFASPQKADILIVSDRLYSGALRRHDIGYIFVMAEQYEEGTTEELSINRLFKYTSLREIFNEIVGKSSDVLNTKIHTKKACQTVLVCSACGGAGKTTVAMGLDNDCTAATAGSIVGAVIGIEEIPAHWTQNFHDTCYSYLNGIERFSIRDMTGRFLRFARGEK